MKIAIVGTGGNARHNYIPFLSEQKGMELSYYDLASNLVAECTSKYGGRAAKSIEDLMSDKPDSVLVLTDEAHHLDVGNALLEYRPKRIFFEKPLHARNGQASVCEQDFFDARDFLTRAHAQGVETAMMFNYRFFEQSLRLQEFISTRKMGRVRQASMLIQYCCWSHCLDLIRNLCGGPVRVTALSSTEAYGDEKLRMRGVDIAAALLLENGATVTLLGTSGPDIYRAPIYTGTLNFENGMVHLSDLDTSMTIFTPGSNYVETISLLADKSRWDQYKESFKKAIAAYLDSIAKGKAPPVPGLAGLEELQFEVALKRSAAEGRPVDVLKEFPVQG